MNKYKKEYFNIFSEFNNINKYRELKVLVHHGNNRLAHINRVSKMSFYISKILNLDYISCTRGALMHDFFTLEDISRNDLRYRSYLKNHPNEALINSKKYFDVNELEEDIILTHMYPLTKEKPKYIESKIVCICDKFVSIFEFFKFEVSLSIRKTLLFCVKVFSV